MTSSSLKTLAAALVVCLVGLATASAQTITPAPASLGNFTTTFGVGSPSATQTFSVNATGLTGNVTLTASAGYELSTNNASFSSNGTLVPVSGNLSSASVFVRISGSPLPAGALAGNVTLTSPGAATKTVSLTGSLGRFVTGPYPLGPGLEILGYNGTVPANLVIPSTINGTDVRGIAASAFEGNATITTLTLPSSLERIEMDAFRNCDNLGSVFIPSNVAFIGDGAFAACDRLASIEVDPVNSPTNYRTIDGVLYDVTAPNARLLQYPAGRPGSSYSIEPAVAGRNVTAIAARAFEEAQNLLAMDIGAASAPGIQTIGDEAFLNAARLARVSFRPTITSIGASAFAYTAGGNGPLVFATFLVAAPSSFGTNVFSGAAAGFEVRYEQRLSGYSAPTWTPTVGQIYNSRIIQQTPNQELTYRVVASSVEILSTGQTTNATLAIPSTIAGLPVRSIAANAFVGDANITSVQLPTSLTAIGQDAFYGCSSLDAVGIAPAVPVSGQLNIPANITNLGVGAFGNCPLLTAFVVDPSNPNYSSPVSNDAILDRTGRKLIQYRIRQTLTFPPAGTEWADSLTEIGERAFEDNQTLIRVELGDRVTTIGRRAFFNNHSLASIRFGNQVASIGNEAFATSIGALGEAIFLGKAPVASNTVFLGSPQEFVVRYLRGIGQFTGAQSFPSGASGTWYGYSAREFSIDGDWEFTTNNGTVSVMGYRGAPPQTGSLLQDFFTDFTDLRPTPDDRQPTAANITALPPGSPTGQRVLDVSTDTIYTLDNYNNLAGRWEISVLNTNNARLRLSPSASLGIVVLEQDNTGPIYFQKVANPGTNATDWIRVNFQLPNQIAGLPVAEIQDFAFSGSTMRSIALPPGLTKIGKNAFLDCRNLGLFDDQRAVFLPAAVNEIRTAPFLGCVNVQNIFVHSSNPFFSAVDGVLYTKTQEKLVQYPPGKLGIEFTTLPSTLEILESAFEGSQYLSVINTSNTLTTIAERAFFGSAALVQANFGSGLNTLGNASFSSIPSLGSVVFRGDWLGSYTFGSEVFYRASDNFVINYFSGAIFVPPIVGGNWTVSGQTYKAAVVNFDGDYRFTTNQTNLTVTIDGYRGSGGNITIPSLILGNPVRAIADLVFAGNDNIVSVVIPSSVTTIGNGTFAEAPKLASVNLGTGLTTIGTEAFFDCDALTAISIPAGVNAIGLGAFGDSNALASITVDPGNPVYSSLDGVLFDKLQSKIVQYPGGKVGPTYDIPATVTTIGKRAFEFNATLASLVIPPTLSTIEANAFERSQLLYEVEFGTGVTFLGDSAFANISTLAQATFLRLTAPTLGTGVFANAAPGFTVYYMPAATGYTTGGWTAYNPTVLTTENNFEFQTANGSVTITKYTGTNSTIVIPPSIGGAPVRAIAPNVFKNNLVITSVSIPPSVSSIGSEVFAGTENLQSVTLGSGLSTIGAGAFRGSGLTSISIPASVTSIGAGAFADCFNLEEINVNDNNPVFSSSYSVLVGSTVRSGSGVLFNKNRTELIVYPMAKAGTEFIVPGTVRIIRENAFEKNLNLVIVESPDSLEEIRQDAFRGSQSLVVVRFGTGLKTLGSRAFGSIQSLNQAVFLGNAPDGTEDVFADANADFRILYLAGRTGYVGGGAKDWLAGYPLVPFQDDQQFEFTSANGTVEITRFIGVPPLAGQPPQILENIDARPLPQRVVANAAERTSFQFVPPTQPIGSYILQEDTNTIWINTGFISAGTRWEWEVYESNDARLTLPPATSLGTTVLEQINTGPVVYQKIANPGTNPEDWIQVNFEIPERVAGLPVTAIGPAAFANNKLLQSIVIPPSVTKIGADAFLNCEQLGRLGSLTDPKGIFIPAAVNQIGTGAFGQCRLLENIFVHTSNPVFTSQSGVLYTKNLSELRQYPVGKLGIEFTTPVNVKTITERAFEGNRYLALVNLSLGVETIQRRAFYGSQALAQARLGAGVKNVGDEAFAMIPSLGSAVFAGNAPVPPTGSFGANVFAGTSDNFQVNYFVGATGFNIVNNQWIVPNNPPYPIRVVSVSGDYEFKIENNAIVITGYLGNGGAIQIPASLGNLPVRVIGTGAFANNQNITSITLPNSVARIESSAFAGMEALASVQFGVGLVSIGEDAFLGCSALTAIEIPAGVVEIGAGAFGVCEALESITVNTANPNFRSTEGVLFDKSQQTLLQYPGGKAGETYTIPATVKTIGPRAFEQNGNLIAMDIPNGVSTIEARAFYRAFGVARVLIGSGVTAIGDEAFADIAVLSAVTFQGDAPAPDAMGANLFVGSSPSFQVLYYEGATGFTTPEWLPNAENPPYPALPLTSVGDFEFTIDANREATITGYIGIGGPVEIPSTIGGFPVRAIGAGAFQNNTFITSVVLPNSINVIGANAFAGAENLESITFGSGLTTIGDGAFRGAENLTTVEIPASVTTIGVGAFAGCLNLEAINVSDANPRFSSTYSVVTGSTVVTGSGVLFNKNRTELILYPMAKGGSEFIVPGTVRFVMPNAFEGNLNLVTVEFPDTVEEVREKAFFGSQSLVSLRFGTGLKVLGSESFAGIPALNQAVFLGDAPEGSVNVFTGHSSSFRILYLAGRKGFVGPEAKPWLAGYTLVPFQDDGDFEFTSANGTVEITRFTGVPPLPGGLAQLIPDLTTRPSPNLVVASSSALAEPPSPNATIPYTTPTGTLVLTQDTNTLWVLATITSNNGAISGRTWDMFDTENARFRLPANTSPGTTVLEQNAVVGKNAVGPLIYQKIGGTGSSEADWIQVNFEIPATIAGLPVTSIGTAAFANNKLLQSVVIPPSVTKIGENAFLNCEQLGRLGLLTEPKGVFIPAAVNQIGTGAFGQCRSLENLFVHTSNPGFTSQEGVLYTKNLSELRQYPVGKLGIEFTTPANVKTIGTRAFEGNRFLALVTLSQGVQTIGERAFYGSQALAQARLGVGVKNVGTEAFAAIPSLGSAVFEGNAPVPPAGSFGANVFAGASDNFEVNYFVRATGFNIVGGKWIVPNNPPYPIDVVNVAGDYEFKIENNQVIITGYLGNGGAIQIPASLGNLPVRVIGTGAFAFNQSITSVTLPASVARIENSAFAGMDALTSVQFGVGLVSIGEDAFFGCAALPEVTIPAGVLEIGDGAFGACDALQQILVNPANTKFRSAEGVLFDKSQQTLRQYPGGKEGETYTISSSVKTIGARSFERNGNLISMAIPSSVTEIQEGAFNRAFGIAQVVIGAGVNKIGDEAFADIAVLSTAIFQGDEPQSFGANVFAGTSTLFQVRYFAGNSGFGTPTWTPAGNPSYAAFPLGEEGDFEFEIANGQAIIKGYIGLGGLVIIPSEIGGFPVRSIKANAFRNNSTITAVLLPATLTTIGEGAFYNCSSIQFIQIPANVITIGPKAFASCDSLFGFFVDSANRSFVSDSFGALFNKNRTALLQFPIGLPELEYEIPDTVTRVAEEAFLGSKSLEKVFLGKNVETLETRSFAEMPALVAAVFYGKAPNLGANVFQNASPEFEVQYVPGSGTVAGATPFPTNPAGGIWNNYTAVPVSNIGDFEFTVANATVTIEGYTGEPRRLSGRDYVIPTTLDPQQTVADQSARDNLPTTNAVGYKVLQRDNDTVYVLKEVRAATGNTTAQNVWEILVVNNYLQSNPALPLGTIYKQQDADGPLYYQKVASPGNQTTDWIRVSSTTLVIPSTLAGLPVAAIADGAFEGNTDISSVKLPDTLKKIGAFAFSGCTNLGSPDGWLGNDRGIFIPANVESFGQGPFAYCTDLLQILVDPANRNFISTDGVLYSKDRSVLVQYPAGNFATAFSPWPRALTIAASAFEGNGFLESVVLPNSIRTIGSQAFYGSAKLQEITFGTGVRAIGDSAFAQIPSLVLATFEGNAPKELGSDIFAGASRDFVVRYTAGKSGFNVLPWTDFNRQPVWPPIPDLSPTTGFRAIGTVDPVKLTGNIGGQISLAVSRSRVVTGSITMGETPKGSLATYRFSGTLSPEGVMQISIPRRLKSTLNLNLELDLNNAPNYFKFNSNSRLVDTVTDDFAPVAAAIVPWSATFPATLYGGQYNIALKTSEADAGQVDPGYGFLTATINSRTGAVRVAGVLADGTRATSSTMLLGRDSDAPDASNAIPLWIPLYRNHGMLLGDLELRREDGKSMSAELLWTKPPEVPRSTNIAGFRDVLLEAEKGSGIFNAPAASLFNGLKLNFDDGMDVNIDASFVESRGRIRPDSAATKDYNMKASWNLRSGLFQGTFTPSRTERKRLTRFQGIILYNNETNQLQTFGNFQLPNIQPQEGQSFFQGGSVSN